jgi:hypothetical protein
MRKRFGELYENLRLKSGKTVFLQPSFFLLRRLILAFAVVVVQEVLIGQIYLIWLQCIIAVCVMEYAYPFKTQGERRMELFNEVILILVLYTMMCFTQFVPEVDTREKIGYVSSGLVALHFLVNLAIMLSVSCCNAKKSCRLHYARKNQEKERQTT